MYISINKEQLAELILKLKVGQGFDFSDLSYRYNGGLINEDYLEDHNRVELVNFYDSPVLIMGGYQKFTSGIDFADVEDRDGKEEARIEVLKLIDSCQLGSIVLDFPIVDSQSLTKERK